MHGNPIVFRSRLEACGEFEKQWTIQSGQHNALCSIPPEFNGHGGGFSPEDLYLQALMNCFVGTFKVYAKASKINFQNIYVEGKLNVDKDESNKTMMKSCHLEVFISGCDRPDRLKTITDKVIRDGFILNSVKTQIEYQIHEGTPS